MTAKEVIARAAGESYDGVADPVKTPNNWARGVSCADAILAALEAAGYVVAERFVIDALVAALEKAKDWMISCDAPTWGRMEIEEADAALALARKEG